MLKKKRNSFPLNSTTKGKQNGKRGKGGMVGVLGINPTETNSSLMSYSFDSSCLYICMKTVVFSPLDEYLSLDT